VAAMKHVDIIEENPIEGIRTNVDGTVNVARCCLMSSKTKHMVYSSTDKAVDPINTYGFTKALGEKYLYNLNRTQEGCKFSVYRWGNVLGSQGSAIPLFIESLMKEKRVYLTHPEMTRFWIPIDWAVNYMIRTFQGARLDQAMVPPNMKTASLAEIVDTLAHMLGLNTYTTTYTGIRPGEKIHEAMYSEHTKDRPMLNSESSPQYSRNELIDMLAPFIKFYRAMP
jgi:FlaA1/EpsC-like NDP-sugar epimerase